MTILLTLAMLIGRGTEMLVDVGPTENRVVLGGFIVLDHHPCWRPAIVVGRDGRGLWCRPRYGHRHEVWVPDDQLSWIYLVRLVLPGRDFRL